MEDSKRIEDLLVEIRDITREQLDEYRALAQKSVGLQEEAVERQAAAVALYRRVVMVALGLLVLLCLFWFLGR